MSLLGVEECASMGLGGRLCVRKAGHPEAHRASDGVEWPKSLQELLAPSTEGRKNDDGKPDFTLLPWPSIREVVRVLHYGAFESPQPDGTKGYGRDNWHQVPNARERYLKAAMRHLVARIEGETHDVGERGSGLPHLAHCACSVLFALWFDLKERNTQT